MRFFLLVAIAAHSMISQGKEVAIPAKKVYVEFKEPMLIIVKKKKLVRVAKNSIRLDKNVKQ